MAVTVLIVDDDAGFRDVVRRMLESCGFNVVAEASEATEADAAVAKLRPELVLVDVQLPGEDGLELTRRLTSLPTGPAVVLISSRDARDYGRRLEESGARGFIPKARLSCQTVYVLMQKPGILRNGGSR